MGFSESIWDHENFKQYVAANTSCSEDWAGATLAKIPTMEHNALVASLLGPSFAGEFPWVGIYNFANYDYYFTQVDQEKLYFSNWETGLPSHTSSANQKCVQMNWRTKQTYHDIVKL